MKCKKAYADQEKFREYRYRSKMKYYTHRNFAIDAKRPWTDEETQIVMEHRTTDTEIAKRLRRSVAAVQARRHKVREMANRQQKQTAGEVGALI